MKPLGGSNMNKLSKFALSCSVGFLFFFSLNVVSQEVEEVVVTATKKAESVQDLALSIQAFTAEDVSENMIENMSDLAEVVPGLIMDKGIGSGVLIQSGVQVHTVLVLRLLELLSQPLMVIVTTHQVLLISASLMLKGLKF